MNNNQSTENLIGPDRVMDVLDGSAPLVAIEDRQKPIRAIALGVGHSNMLVRSRVPLKRTGRDDP